MTPDDSVTRRDLETAQQALRDILAILGAIAPGADDVFYQIGRAMGCARMGVIQSGGLTTGRRL